MTTNPGWNGGFPGDWTYHGNAKLLVQDTIEEIQISLRLIFIEEADIDVKIIWQEITDDYRSKLILKMENTKTQVIIIPYNNLLLIGYSVPPSISYLNNHTTRFNVVKLITYKGYHSSIDFRNDFGDDFIQLRAYLNDEFSSIDEIFNTEFENTPRQRNQDFTNRPGPYCILNSGYKFKCGKKYIVHQDHDVLYKKNIEVLYKLSFIDIMVSLFNETINKFNDSDNDPEVNLSRHLEEVVNNLCGFLSIICNYEILPIYYDYSIYSQNKYMIGRIIPIWKRRKIAKVSRAWFTRGIHFAGDITLFLECCPINKQISRGIEHLKITVYESTVELQLMAACSAIEYFYSYWFWELEGVKKLENAVFEKNSLIKLKKKNIDDLKKQSNKNDKKTPYLSQVIQFFLKDLEIEREKYINTNHEVTPTFIQIRNKLLHGSFISDDLAIYESKEVAQKLATKILFAIMKRISQSNESNLYENLLVRPPIRDFYTLSDGWVEIKELLNELHNNQKPKKFWIEI
jgi:hypothetical protein